MFRLLTIVAVAAVIAGTFIHYLMHKREKAARPAPMPRYPRIERLLAWMAALGFITLAFTGFVGATLPGQPLQGYWTLIHVSASGMFATGLACLAVMRGQAYAFGSTVTRFSTAQRICFWTIAASTLVLVLSIVVPMLRLLGTPEQTLAIEVHRAAALVSLLAAMVYVHLARLRA